MAVALFLWRWFQENEDDKNLVSERRTWSDLLTEKTSDSGAQAPSRDELAVQYLELLPYTPYPVQEQALLEWFSCEEGVLVCAPTGTGKTLIAEAAAFEALHTGQTIYYTTPLIALTEQKFREMQAAAVSWGFSPDEVGLVTGNRRVNPEAKVLVVVAEILLNRLLHPEAFDFSGVSAVVMDEFHSFSDPSRGIVWEFSLSLLPKHVRLLLLSATIGNAPEFLSWLRNCHGRRLELVQSNDRKVPLEFTWVADKLLNEHLEEIAQGEGDYRRTPALLFCFNRDECWSVAEMLKGKSMLAPGQQKKLIEQLDKYDWSKGAGPKLKQILMRGVGVHHAGLLPRYRRIVEELFQKKLLSICVCTETLSAGINLPARSVVLPSLIKGPPGKQKLIDPSSAHQIFGRAGRPQFDTSGSVYALAHEDDVKILRWKERYDQIPEDTKDPKLLQARKALKKKMPTRSPNRQYWNEQQFEKLKTAPPRNLVSTGHLPWRLLAYMLQISPDVELVRELVRKRLMDPKEIEQGQKELQRMLLTLHALGVVRLEPEPPQRAPAGEEPAKQEPEPAAPEKPKLSNVGQQLMEALRKQHEASGRGPAPVAAKVEEPAEPEYMPRFAYPTERMRDFFIFRSVNPVYALFLLDLFGLADMNERLQALESVLELPRSLMRYVRVPPPDKMPPGPLARNKVDEAIVQRGLIPAGDLYPQFDPDVPFEERKYPPTLADKLRMLFESEYPGVHSLFVQPVWVAGDLLQFECQFDKYISGRGLMKQEGLIFRHVLRLILLLGEFSQVTPAGVDGDTWRTELRDLADRLTEGCREIDPTSTESVLAHASDIDLVTAEPAETTPPPPATEVSEEEAVDADEFGAGLFDGD